MTFRRSARIVLGAVVAGLIVGIVSSGGESISVEVWVGASAVTIVAMTLRDLLTAAALEPSTMIPAWALTSDSESVHGPRGLRNLRSLVSSAVSSPRVYTRRLRPHLVALADHFLPRRHGLEMAHDAMQVTTLLGDVHWLIDPTVNDRAPTTDEFERFLNIILDDEGVPRTTTHRDGAPIP